MQSTFSYPLSSAAGSARTSTNTLPSSAAKFLSYTPVSQTRETNPTTVSQPTAARALIRRSTRLNVEFTKEAWRQFTAMKGNIFTALVMSVTVKADLALYITAHSERGIRLDNLCQEVCYEPGVYFTLMNVRGTWYITEIITTEAPAGYAPVHMWQRIKRGCNVLAAKVLIAWRRVLGRRDAQTCGNAGDTSPEAWG